MSGEEFRERYGGGLVGLGGTWVCLGWAFARPQHRPPWPTPCHRARRAPLGVCCVRHRYARLTPQPPKGARRARLKLFTEQTLHPRLMPKLKSLCDGEFCNKPPQDCFLVIFGGSPDVSKQHVEVWFGWPCILEAFVTIGALGHQIGGCVLAAFALPRKS